MRGVGLRCMNRMSNLHIEKISDNDFEMYFIMLTVKKDDKWLYLNEKSVLHVKEKDTDTVAITKERQIEGQYFASSFEEAVQVSERLLDDLPDNAACLLLGGYNGPGWTEEEIEEDLKADPSANPIDLMMEYDSPDFAEFKAVIARFKYVAKELIQLFKTGRSTDV